MLILTRMVGERLVIGGNVIVTVASSDGVNVRLGFDAPREIPIDRLEIRQVKERVKAKETGGLA